MNLWILPRRGRWPKDTARCRLFERRSSNKGANLVHVYDAERQIIDEALRQLAAEVQRAKRLQEESRILRDWEVARYPEWLDVRK